MDPYEVLIEVTKTESLTRAAENLYTSQPSISRDIKRLELKYNVKIFGLRSPYLKLTGDGEKLLQYTLQRGSIEQELWRDLTSGSEIISGTLTIGGSYTYSEYLLSERLTNLMRQCPKLHIHLRVNNSNSVINDIRHSRMDIGIVEKEIQDNAIERKEVTEDEIACIYKNRFNLERIYVSLEKKGLEQGFIRK